MTITYPLPTLAAQVSATGISAPAYNDIWLSLQASFQAIYGSDAYIDPDSQDGQLLAIFARAVNDSNNTAIAVYNAFSPLMAQGVGLDTVVAINGIERNIASNSTVDQIIIGVAGTIISNGVTQDASGNLWSLPSSITIPSSGSITVTATCQTAGAISPAIGTVNIINTPTLGWQSVNNATAGSPGNAVETDAALRVRQAASVALPSMTVLGGIVGSVESITGVTEVAPYENPNNVTDTNGLPPHSIALVVQGGDAVQIATAIMNKKTPGAATYGTTTEVVVDAAGISNTINFFRPAVSNIAVGITLHALSNYTTVIAAEIKSAIATYINGLSIGQNVMITRLYVPAQLNGAADSQTFEIVGITAGLVGSSLGSSDITIPFNGLAVCTASNVTITVA